MGAGNIPVITSELWSAGVNGPVAYWEFSVSAGSALDRTSLGVKWQLPVRSRGRSSFSGSLRSSSGNPV
jgi:hypothetical protein